jgi:L-lactate dehydrogenase complex protein LldF
VNLHSQDFIARSREGIGNPDLQSSLGVLGDGMPRKRQLAMDAIGNFEEQRQYVVQMKDHTLANMAAYLEQFEAAVKANGGQVHWAETPEAFNRIITNICQTAGAERVVKGKSMVTEETGLNQALQDAGLDLLETDLGEYIIQLAREHPSHIVVPAIHKTVDQVRQLFLHHHDLGERELPDPTAIVTEARQMLRNRFGAADVGIVGANALIAETGSTLLVTNEGNGDLCSTLPRVQIVASSIEKVLPTLDDASSLLRLLTRSATGQAITCYTSFYSGPKRERDIDGPEQFHVVLLDNGRSEMLAGEYREMLRCIRCGSCLNHCPVYTHVGGHAYGWVYPGPMGSVLTPLMQGLEGATDLPVACTTCGRCQEACPMDIPLPDMLRQLRAETVQQKLNPRRWRWGIRAYMHLLAHPTLYRWGSRLVMPLMAKLAGRKRRFRSLLLANGWTDVRDFPAPQGQTFLNQWQRTGSGVRASDD